MFHIKIQAMFILTAALCAVPAYAKPAKTAKAAATPVEVPTQPAEPEGPAKDYKTFVMAISAGFELSQIEYTYSYTYKPTPSSPYLTANGSRSLLLFGPQIGLSTYITPVSFLHFHAGAKVSPVRGLNRTQQNEELLGVAVSPFLNLGFRLGKLGPLGMVVPFIGANYSKYIPVLNFDKLDYSFISAVGGLEFMGNERVFGLSYEQRVVALDSSMSNMSSWRASIYVSLLFGG